MSHRYAVGQMLDMRSSTHANKRPAGPCEVLFRLPNDRGPLLYRVRPLNDKVERVVAESDLSPSEAVRAEAAGGASPFSISITRR